MAPITRSSVLSILGRCDSIATLPGAIFRIAHTGDLYLFTRHFFDDMLARLSGPGGIRSLLQPTAHPGLTLAVEGHTDNVAGDEANQKLSEQRADTVRSYLIGQGLPEARKSSTGFGKTSPMADNDTATGRQKNRRVEIVVSGEVIGEKIGT
jgi:hypothetical protein